MSLARLNFARGDADSCEKTLRALLRINRDHKDAGEPIHDRSWRQLSPSDMLLASVMALRAQKALTAFSADEEGVLIESTDE